MYVCREGGGAWGMAELYSIVTSGEPDSLERARAYMAVHNVPTWLVSYIHSNACATANMSVIRTTAELFKCPNWPTRIFRPRRSGSLDSHREAIRYILGLEWVDVGGLMYRVITAGSFDLLMFDCLREAMKHPAGRAGMMYAFHELHLDLESDVAPKTIVEFVVLNGLCTRRAAERLVVHIGDYSDDVADRIVLLATDGEAEWVLPLFGGDTDTTAARLAIRLHSDKTSRVLRSGITVLAERGGERRRIRYSSNIGRMLDACNRLQLFRPLLGLPVCTTVRDIVLALLNPDNYPCIVFKLFSRVIGHNQRRRIVVLRSDVFSMLYNLISVRRLVYNFLISTTVGHWGRSNTSTGANTDTDTNIGTDTCTNTARWGLPTDVERNIFSFLPPQQT